MVSEVGDLSGVHGLVELAEFTSFFGFRHFFEQLFVHLVLSLGHLLSKHQRHDCAAALRYRVLLGFEHKGLPTLEAFLLRLLFSLPPLSVLLHQVLQLLLVKLLRLVNILLQDPLTLLNLRLDILQVVRLLLIRLLLHYHVPLLGFLLLFAYVHLRDFLDLAIAFLALCLHLRFVVLLEH